MTTTLVLFEPPAESAAPQDPPAKIAARLDAAASLIGDGDLTLRKAAKCLGCDYTTIKHDAWKYAKYFARQVEQTHATAKRIRTNRRRSAQIKNWIKTGARLVAAGKSINAAARRMELPPFQLHHVKERHAAEWAEQYAIGKRELAAAKIDRPKGPTAATREKISRATALAAAGLQVAQIAEQLKVSPETVHAWKRKTKYAAVWREEFDRIMPAAVELVKAQAGTEAIKDPAEFMRRAMVAERWARDRRQSIFPNDGKTVTLTGFYASYYKRVRLADCAASTRADYETVLRLWALLTGDPPLAQIDVLMLSRFKECLKARASTARGGHFRDDGPQTRQEPPGPFGQGRAGVVSQSRCRKPLARSGPVD